MFIFQSANPCICSGSSNPPSVGGCDDCVCIEACNIVLPATDINAVGPCGQNGALDLTAYDHDFSGCGVDPVQWSLYSFDNTVFTAVAVSLAGNLTYTTGANSGGQHGQIIVRVQCGLLSTYITVLIGVANLCFPLPPCSPGEVCDPCTGDCIPDLNAGVS